VEVEPPANWCYGNTFDDEVVEAVRAQDFAAPGGIRYRGSQLALFGDS
jgi:hypothetical protein